MARFDSRSWVNHILSVPAKLAHTSKIVVQSAKAKMRNKSYSSSSGKTKRKLTLDHLNRVDDCKGL